MWLRRSGRFFRMAEGDRSGIERAIRKGWEQGWGSAYAVGGAIQEKRPPCRHLRYTPPASGWDPVRARGVGTDISTFIPRSAGRRSASQATAISGSSRAGRPLKEGFNLNLGSAVILRGGFSEALTLARNLGHPARDFHHGQHGLYPQYRPLTNVVPAPPSKGARISPDRPRRDHVSPPGGGGYGTIGKPKSKAKG